MALSARDASPVSRIQSSRDRSSPTADADTGSKRSCVSTSATASPRAAAAASTPQSTRHPAGRSQADDLGQLSAPQPAAEHDVEGRHAGAGAILGGLTRAPGLYGGQRHIQLAGAQQRFEVGAGSHFRFLFASTAEYSAPLIPDQAQLVPSV